MFAADMIVFFFAESELQYFGVEDSVLRGLIVAESL